MTRILRPRKACTGFLKHEELYTTDTVFFVVCHRRFTVESSVAGLSVITAMGYLDSGRTG